MYFARTEGAAGGSDEVDDGVGCCWEGWEDLLESSPWSISRNFWSSASADEAAEEEGDGVDGVSCCRTGGAASGCVAAGRLEVSVGLPEEAAGEEGEDQNQPIVSFCFEGKACRVRLGTGSNMDSRSRLSSIWKYAEGFKHSIDREQSSVFELNRLRGNKASMR